MGVINVTPDSFSDGGKFLHPADAVAHAMRLLESGADILDVGAESTRPGAGPVAPEEERSRLIPVVKELLQKVPPECLSIDTRREAIALEMASMGVGYINNVGGLFSLEVMKNLAVQGCSYIAMQMNGTPEMMQSGPLSRASAIEAMDRFLDAACTVFDQAGFAKSRCFVDPGIGFGKSDAANLALLGSVPRYSERCQVAIGVSRKSMFGRLLGIEIPEDRDSACKMLEFLLGVIGAKIIRTHDVATLAQIRGTYDSGA